jgi:hypothetical protein
MWSRPGSPTPTPGMTRSTGWTRWGCARLRNMAKQSMRWFPMRLWTPAQRLRLGQLVGKRQGRYFRKALGKRLLRRTLTPASTATWRRTRLRLTTPYLGPRGATQRSTMPRPAAVGATRRREHGTSLLTRRRIMRVRGLPLGGIWLSHDKA